MPTQAEVERLCGGEAERRAGPGDMRTGRGWAWKVLFTVMVLACSAAARRDAWAQKSTTSSEPEKVIIDTDIGDDIDDAFALALALSTPKLHIIGVTTAWGDTDLRARLTARFLAGDWA